MLLLFCIFPMLLCKNNKIFTVFVHRTNMTWSKLVFFFCLAAIMDMKEIHQWLVELVIALVCIIDERIFNYPLFLTLACHAKGLR